MLFPGGSRSTIRSLEERTALACWCTCVSWRSRDRHLLPPLEGAPAELRQRFVIVESDDIAAPHPCN